MDDPKASIHVVVAGYGLAGRCAAKRALDSGGTAAVIELNGQTVRRCGRDESGRLRFVCGDASDESCLVEAGIAEARLLVLALPDDPATLKAAETALRLNPRVGIIARTEYTSTGLEASKRGAGTVVVAEQVVAKEIDAAVAESLGLRP